MCKCGRQEPVRSAIDRLCKLSGIRVSDRLVRHKTTHLLCRVGVGESDKLLNARAWGTVHILSIEWLLQCIRTGQRVPEAEFLVEAPAAGLEQAAPVADVSEPSDTHKGAVARQQPAASDPLALQKPQGDEPDCMLDFVAKLTSVAKATGKRRARYCRRTECIPLTRCWLQTRARSRAGFCSQWWPEGEAHVTAIRA